MLRYLQAVTDSVDSLCQRIIKIERAWEKINWHYNRLALRVRYVTLHSRDEYLHIFSSIIFGRDMLLPKNPFLGSVGFGNSTLKL